MIRNIYVFLIQYFIIYSLIAVTKANDHTGPIEIIDIKGKSVASDDVVNAKEKVSAPEQDGNDSNKAALLGEVKVSDILSESEFAPTEGVKDKRSTEFGIPGDEVRYDSEAESMAADGRDDETDDLLDKSGDDSLDLKSEAAEDIERSAYDVLDDELRSEASSDKEPTIERIDGQTDKNAEERAQAEDRINLEIPKNIILNSRRMLNNLDSNSKTDVHVEESPKRLIARTPPFSGFDDLNHFGGLRRGFHSDFAPRPNTYSSFRSAPVMNRAGMFFTNKFPMQSTPSTNMMVSRSSSSEAGPMGGSMTSKTRVLHNGVEILNEEKSEGSMNKANSYPYTPSSISNPILPQNSVNLLSKFPSAPPLSISKFHSAEDMLRPYPNMFNPNSMIPNNYNSFMLRSRRYANSMPKSRHFISNRPVFKN